MSRMPRLMLPVMAGALLSAGKTALAEDAEGRAMLREAQRVVAAYHAGEPRSKDTLRVVYFVPKDRDPLPAHAERLDRVLTDIRRFYQDGLRRFGIETDGLPLERNGGKLALHLVRGSAPADQYHHESGDRTAAEIRGALKGQVDLDREHVLVFYALCRREADGRYVFDAPYYGGGSHQSGLCHAADCELLDPALLTDTKRRMVYTEHYYPRVEETVARFNTKYLGGTAHELGHGLGLPHDDGSEPERKFGPSLMGNGNLSYRQDVWGGGAPAYLSRGSALRLIAHPLVTGSNRGRWDDVAGGFDSLKATTSQGRVRIEGSLISKIPAYAVVAYVWPSRSKTDHGARTFPVLLKDGSFALELDGLRPESYQLKLAGLHANGAATTVERRFGFDNAGKPDVASLNAEWIVDRAERAVMKQEPEARRLLNDRAIADVPTPEGARKLRVLRAVLDPPAPIDLGKAQDSQVFLSDARWTAAKVGWGHVTRNAFWFDDQFQRGVFLMLAGQFHEKGLYAHSPARYKFELNRKWKTFTSTVGLRDGALKQGSAVFTVVGDGRELYRSRVLRAGDLERVTVDVAKVKELELLTQGGEGHNHNSWAIWVDPKLER